MKKNIFFLKYIIFIVIKINILYCQQNWFYLPSPTSYPIFGIYFKNVNSGIVDGYKTSNGGLSWTNPNVAINSYSIFFPDTNIGYSVGISFNYKTTNFGNNWILQSRPSGIYYGAYFLNVNTGYESGIQKIIKTTNGGMNWMIQNTPVSSEYALYNIYFIDTINGFAVGNTYANSPDSSVILSTTNGGLNWFSCAFPYSFGRQLYSLYFININTGFAGGSQYVYKTTNAGNSWIIKTSNTTNMVYSLYFPSNTIGYGCCMYGDIIKTTNCGESWFKQNSPTGNSLTTIYFVNNNTGYICGESGIILKTTNGGGPPIGIKPISNNVPEKFELYQNYPNPFNPATTIKYDIPKATMVTIKVYDILGKEVSTLVNEFMQPGYYEAQFNGTNLASGIYFYRIRADEYISVKKMILIK